MKVFYKTNDGSIDAVLEFTFARNLRNYPGYGKSWPLTTQCVLNINGLVKGVGTVVKHEKERTMNGPLAMRLAAKKALEQSRLSKYIKTEIWNAIFDQFEKGGVEIPNIKRNK